jgi:ABC-type phosphate transport system permease subunit
MVKIDSPLYFDRHVLLVFALLFSSLSLWLSSFSDHHNLFSSSGAVVTVAGLFLNIKHTLLFHLKIPLANKYGILNGAFGFGSNELTPEQEKQTRSVLSDEKFGVFFMIFGTLIWAYGNYLVECFYKI